VQQKKLRRVHGPRRAIEDVAAVDIGGALLDDRHRALP
jgi:hypothetical protein